eukprot:15447871-Alexandrium_andersonii.AAC.1
MQVLVCFGALRCSPRRGQTSVGLPRALGRSTRLSLSVHELAEALRWARRLPLKSGWLSGKLSRGTLQSPPGLLVGLSQ